MIKELISDIYINIGKYESKGIFFTNSWTELCGLTLKCKITYPLTKVYTFDIPIPDNVWPVNFIIESIIGLYKEIYKDTNNYYGHGLEDLVIASISWNTDTNELKLIVDS